MISWALVFASQSRVYRELADLLNGLGEILSETHIAFDHQNMTDIELAAVMTLHLIGSRTMGAIICLFAILQCIFDAPCSAASMGAPRMAYPTGVTAPTTVLVLIAGLALLSNIGAAASYEEDHC